MQRKRKSSVRVADGTDMMAAIAVDDILSHRGGRERVADLSAKDHAAGEALWESLHGRSPDGNGLPPVGRLTHFQAAAPVLKALLLRAHVAAGGQLDQAAHAQQLLMKTGTVLESAVVDAATADVGRAAELQSPKAKVERQRLIALATDGLAVFATADKFLGTADVEGATKKSRDSRIKVLEGIIALCKTDDYPSYSKMVEDLDKQLARTDPDRMLGASATVLEHVKKAADFTTQSLTLLAMGLQKVFSMRGMAQQAAVLGRAVEGLSKFSSAFAALDLIHGTLVLLDDNATASQKIEGGLEVASGGVGLIAAGAEAVGAEAVAGAAGAAAAPLAGAAITYKSYKALAEYGYTAVVGGLSAVEVTDEIEGMKRIGGLKEKGLDHAASRVTEARLRVEALMERGEGGPGGGVQHALGKRTVLLQNAIHDMARHWNGLGLAEIRRYQPVIDPVEWANAMDAQAEAFMVVDMARSWEGALVNVMVNRDAIINEVMHNTMKN